MPKVTAEEERVGAAPTKDSKPKCADIMVWEKKLFFVKIFSPTFNQRAVYCLSRASAVEAGAFFFSKSSHHIVHDPKMIMKGWAG
jgi:hypothetical protein